MRTPRSSISRTSICFNEAYKLLRSSEIDDDQYLSYCLAHFAGVRHDEDGNIERKFNPHSMSAVGEAVRHDALRMHYRPLSDHRALHGVFKAAGTGNPEGFMSAAANHEQTLPHFELPWQALATYCASHGHGEVFQSCLEHGATIQNPYTDTVLRSSAKDETLLNILYDADWNNIRTSQSAMDKFGQSAWLRSGTEIDWCYRHGGRISKAALESRAWNAGLNASAVAAFLKHDDNGIDMLRSTGMLQKAAAHDNVDLLRVLLEAGADPNEEVVTERPDLPEHIAWDRGEDPSLALRDAISHGAACAVRILLEYGADIELVDRENGASGALKMASRTGNMVVVDILEKHLRRRSKM